MTTLHDPHVAQTLSSLHHQAAGDGPRILRGFARSLGLGLEPQHMKDAYISVSPEQGRFLHALARGAGARHIIEFGASFGISSLYLGAAARDTGGRVLTTEIEPNKIAAAQAAIERAGLYDVVTLLPGDALETLAAQALEDPIDFVFLDGWFDLYIDLLNLLGPRLAPGAMIVMDNANFPGARPILRALEHAPHLTCARVRAGGAMALAILTDAWSPLPHGDH